MGLLATGRRLLDNGLALLQTRVELFSVEWQEEKQRVIAALIWASAALFLSAMALTVATFAIVFLVWESREARSIALIGVTLFYFFAALFSGLMLKKKLRETCAPFMDSLREIRKDRQCLDSQR
ncbi:MAG: phage holin family protein [bacterium]